MANKRIKDLATTKYKGFMALDDADGTGKFDIENLLGAIAPVFNPEKAGGYKKYDTVMYHGEAFIFTAPHTGDWGGNDAKKIPVSQLLGRPVDYSGNFLFNRVVKELYFDPDQVSAEDLASIVKVRTYNGFSGYYGMNFYNASNQLIVGLQDSNNAPVKRTSKGGCVIDYSFIQNEYEDFAVTMTDAVYVKGYSPFINPSSLLNELKQTVSLFGDDPLFNAFVKELYIPSDLVSDIQLASIDNAVLHNGASDLWGITLKSGSSLVLSITALSAVMPANGILYNNNKKAWCIVDFSAISGNVATSLVKIKSSVRDMSLSPTLCYMFGKWAYARKFTQSNDLNKALYELLIDEDDVSAASLASVTRFRIYKGFGSLYGAKLFDADGNTVLDLTSSDDSIFHTSNSGKSGIVVYYSLVEDNSTGYRDYFEPIENLVREPSASPYISSQQNIRQLSQDIEEISPATFTDNDELNAIIKELYITDQVSGTDIASIDNVVVFRGGEGQANGLYFKSGNTAKFGFTTTSVLDDKVYDGNGLLFRLKLPSGTTNLVFNAHLNANTKAVENSPIIYSYLIEKEIPNTGTWFDDAQLCPDYTAQNNQRPIVYEGDTKSTENFVVNSVAYPDGSMIVCRRGGVVAKVARDGTETTLMTISHASDWRLCWMDSNLNVYVSPHSSVDNGGSNIDVSARGLYKLAYGESTFEKVLSLYDTESQVTTETQNNDDTIWRMCEDNDGNLYAGVYAHTVRPNPGIYKSTDGGDTWTYIYNFVTSGVATSGRHIHDIIFNEYDNRLYCIVGEINEIYCSQDGGNTWAGINAQVEDYKGTVLLAVPDGLLVGSDGAYACIFSKVYADGKVQTKGKIWAGTVFGIRRSDVSHAIYAFTKIDSSVNSTGYYPPVAAITDPSALQDWKESSPSNLAAWTRYNTWAASRYPEDAIRPQHAAILVSYDEGESWSILHRFTTGSGGAFGFWTVGQFRNGECLAGFVGSSYAFVKPKVISEGKHKYGASGIDLDGEIFIKLNTSSVIESI